MALRLPSRYEDLDTAYHGRLVPDQTLLALVNRAKKSIDMSGGIRFLPLWGQSGAGKSCAAIEISTHMPTVHTFILSREEIESKELLLTRIHHEAQQQKDKFLVAIIDQFEERVIGKERIPTQFIEHISLLDRAELRNIPTLFIWLTTDKAFQAQLQEATSRNRRILLESDFEVTGPEKTNWPTIIKQTFSFHNAEKCLADYGIIDEDISNLSDRAVTLGSAIEQVGNLLLKEEPDIQNLSKFQVIVVWPVADSLRNTRVLQFSNPKDGYTLNWDFWFSQLNLEDKAHLPLHAYNKTRLYFDFRIIPIRVADLHKLCTNLEDPAPELAQTYMNRFQQTRFFHVVSGNWSEYDYNPVRERESKRATEAEAWYKTVTDKPVLLGKRLAYILTRCGLPSQYEHPIESSYGNVRADVHTRRPEYDDKELLLELKVFSSENTMPSSIKDAIKTTIRKYAQFAGFIGRQ